MRIGLMTDAYYPQIGGVSTSTSLLKDGLRKLGHEAYVITTTDPEQPTHEEHVFRVASAPFFSEKRMTLSYHPKLKMHLEEIGLDMIHTQTEFGIGDFGRSYAKKNNIPHIHTFHTLYEDWLNDQLRAKEGGLKRRLIHLYVRSEARRFCNAAQIIIAPTEKTERVLTSYGVRAPIRIIPTGIDLQRFYQAKDDRNKRHEIRDQYGIRENDRLLIYLGRISQEKQIERLTSYTENQLKRWDNMHFMLVGAGPAVGQMSGIIEKSQYKDRIHYVGPVLMEDVPQYYAAADLFLSASQSETQGLTYIEALASGLPLFVQQDDCLANVLNEDNGLSFHDETSFENGLAMLMSESEEKRRRRSEAAIKKTREYGVRAFVDRVLAVYEEAIYFHQTSPKRSRRSYSKSGKTRCL